MGIFDVFKKKEEPTQQQVRPSPEEIPISQAMQMKERGLTNNQIIQVLQQQGYNPQQIYDALAQAEARQSIAPYAQEQEMPREELPPEAPLMQTQEYPAERPRYEQSTEAIVESIIEEKWKVVQKEITRMTELKDQINTRMTRMEQQLKDLKGDLDGLHKAIIARVGQYDKTLSEVGTEIKAMEKVFKEVLPEMTGSIQELSKLTKKLKGDEKGIKKETKEVEAEKLDHLAKKFK